MHSSKKKVDMWGDAVLSRREESFHNVYVCQIIKLHTLSILQSCPLYLNKAGEK